MVMPRHLVIAIDGLSATGKGTLARGLALTLNLVHRETGLLYRAVGLQLLDQRVDPAEVRAAERAARALDERLLSDPRLGTEEVARVGSIAARHPGVRQALLERQQAWCRTLPPGVTGVVLDGRDIGTVVCPDADLKLYLTADLGIRAARRVRQLGLPETATGDVAAALQERDRRDAADGCQTADGVGVVVVDTSAHSATDTLRWVLDLVCWVERHERRA